MTDPILVANLHKGQVPITLNGVPRVLTPTWECMVQIEQQTGFGLVALATRLASNTFGVTDVVVVIYAGLKASGTPVEPAQIWEALRRNGLLDSGVLKSVTDFVQGCLDGGSAESGEAKADGDSTSSPSGTSSASPAGSSAGRKKRSGKARRTRSTPP